MKQKYGFALMMIQVIGHMAYGPWPTLARLAPLASLGRPCIEPLSGQSNSTTSQMSTKAHGHYQTQNNSS